MRVNISAFMKSPPLPPSLGQPNNASAKPVYLDLSKSEDGSLILKYVGNNITAGFLVDVLRALPRPNEDIKRIEAFAADLYAYKRATLTDIELENGLIIGIQNKANIK
jgi:hypothetical protein